MTTASLLKLRMASHERTVHYGLQVLATARQGRHGDLRDEGVAMTLGEVISRLEKEPPGKIVPLGFAYPHSYRGYYDQLAFEPKINVTIAEMLAAAQSAIGETYCGYKGGNYTMDQHSEVWLAEYGCCGDSIGSVLLDYMCGRSDWC